MLREESVVPPPRVAVPPYHDLLAHYDRFLICERGLAAGTVAIYRRFVGEFLTSRGEAVTPAELVGLTAADLHTFVRKRGAGLGGSSWNNLVAALTSFYRWLDLQGHPARHLIGILPRQRRYRLADVPCALQWEDVQRLLAAVDRDGPDGRRNYAILMLIATYGLRGCEVRALRLEDIDWPKDELTIFASKTGQTRRLPLTRPVGEALLDYLCHERLASTHREIFLSRRPPQGPLRNKFYHWISRCFEKAGVDAPHRGAHTLRHYVPFLTMSCNVKNSADMLGNCRLHYAETDPSTRHSFPG
jgi:integrase